MPSKALWQQFFLPFFILLLPSRCIMEGVIAVDEGVKFFFQLVNRLFI